jgi:DUF1707 SHOCT-like domain
MSAHGSPPGTRGSGSRRRPSYTSPSLRVSDAERTQATDRLSRHYADGRLDESTFSQRLDQAMNAKTQSDLSALFTDLPGAAAPQPAVRRHDRRTPRIVFLVLVIVLAAAAGNALAHTFLPWVLLGLLAAGVLRYGSRQRRRL